MPSHMQMPEEPMVPARGRPQARRPERTGVPVWVFIVTLVFCLAAGGLAGYFFPKGEEIAYLQGKVAITDEELDSIVGSYLVDGKPHEITARQALEATASLESQRNEDGSYPMPSAETVLNVARNQLLQRAVADEGIEVSEEQIEAYRQQVFGSEDVATLAANYSMTEDQFHQMLAEGAAVEQLYEKVTGAGAKVGGEASVPELPPLPAEGEQDTPTSEYGAYIVGLLGENWDTTTDTWANHDNPYYDAMADDVFSIEGATYDQAMEAYYVAYEVGSEANAEGLEAWDAYMTELLASAQVTIAEMVQ